MLIRRAWLGTIVACGLGFSVRAQADLQVSGQVTPTNPAPGGELSCAVHVTNRGPLAATGVVVAIELPAGLAVSNAGPVVISGTNGLWSIPSLAAGATTSAVLQLRIGWLADPVAFFPGPVLSSAFAQVPTVAASGTNRFMVGVPSFLTSGVNYGRAVLYDRAGTVVATVTNPTPNQDDGFGYVLAAVGADQFAVAARSRAVYGRYDGVVHLFDRNGGLRVTITNPVDSADDLFGCAIAPIGTNRILIGESGADEGTIDGGAAHVYDLDGVRLLTVTGTTLSAHFGYAVEAFTSGVTVISSGLGVHVCDAAGVVQVTITNPLPDPGDAYGSTLAVIEPDRIAVGAPSADTLVPIGGRAYLFDTSGALVAALSNLFPTSYGFFGRSLAGSADGVLAVGALDAEVGYPQAGHVHLFDREGVWQTSLRAPLPRASAGFGYDVHWGTSNQLLVAASGLGHAYLFDPGAGGFRLDLRAIKRAQYPPDLVPANDSVFVSTWVGQPAVVSVSKTQTLAQVSASQTNQYAIVVSNAGPGVALGVRVADQIPASLAVLAVSNSAGFWDASTNVWLIPKLEAGEVQRIDLRARVTAASGAVTNAAVLRPGRAGTAGEGDVATAIASIVASNAARAIPELTIRSSFGATTPEAGAYTIDSGTILTAAVLTASVTNYPFVLQPAAWALTGHSVTGGQGAQAVFTVTNSGVLTWLWTTSATFTADLAVGKSVDRPYPVAGDVLTYTLTVTNFGPLAARSVTLEDRLQSELIFQTNAGGTYVATSGLWSVAQIDPGGAVTMSIQAVFAPFATWSGAVTNPTTGSNDRFGDNLAVLPGSGFVAGTPNDDQGLTDSGVVHVFDPDGVFIRTVTNPSPQASDFFGWSTAAVGTNRFLVGAYADDRSATDAGLAYVYDWPGNTFLMMTNPAPSLGDNFGVAVAAVGTSVLAVAAWKDDAGAGDAGTVHLFRTNGTFLLSITNPSPFASDQFGNALAAVGDDRLLIACQRKDVAGKTDAGAVYLYDTNGTLLLTLANPAPSNSDFFGSAIAVLPGPVLAVGCADCDWGSFNSGLVYLFDTNGLLLTTITNPIPGSTDRFGSMLVGAGSNRLLIGSMEDDDTVTDAGSAWLFRTDGRLLARLRDPVQIANQQFGRSAGWLGGDRFVVGAWRDGTSQDGVVHRFECADLGTRIDNTLRRVGQLELDPVPGNDATVTRAWSGASGDVSVTKSQLFQEVVQGQSNTYWITVSNGGPALVEGIRIRESLPPQASLVSANASTGVWDLPSRIWYIPALATGDAAQLTVIVSNSAAAGWQTNVAERIGMSRADLTPANDLAVVVARVVPDLAARTQPVLRIQSPYGTTRPAYAEQQYASGSEVAASVGPASVDVYPFTVAPVGWNLGSHAPYSGTGTQVVFTITNDCTLTWIWNTSRVVQADVAVTKSASTTNPAPGDVVTFTVVASNAGPDAATGVRIIDLLPSGWAYIGHTNGSYVPSNGLWTVSNLAAGASTTLQVTARLLATSGYTTFMLAPELPYGVRLGSCVAAAGDSLALVGAPAERQGIISLRPAGDSPDQGGALYALQQYTEVGQACVFDRNGLIRFVFTNPTPASYEHFGTSVAAWGDELFVVGTPDDRVASPGAVYVYGRDGGLLSMLLDPTSASVDRFGISLAMPASNRIAVGSMSADRGAADAGLVQIFTPNGVLVATLTNPAPAETDHFGVVLAARPDGGLIVGAPYDGASPSDAGAVFVYSASNALVASITNPAPATMDYFGLSVAAVGSTGVLIGVPNRDYAGFTDSGVAYLYNATGSVVTVITNPTPATGDRFGTAVAVLPSGLLAIGSPGDGANGRNAGTVHLFDPGGRWTGAVAAPVPKFSNNFGHALAAWGQQEVLAGCPYDDFTQTDAGAVYAFDVTTAGLRLTNRAARLAQTEVDPVASNDASTVVFDFGPLDDVTISKSIDVTEVVNERLCTYRIVVSNAGATEARGLVIRERHAKTGLQTYGAIPSAGHWSAQTNTWLLSVLPPGATETLRYSAYPVPLTGAVTNEAAIVRGDRGDANPSNDSAVVVIPVVAMDSMRAHPVLNVSSAYGSSTPSVGEHSIASGTVVVATAGPAMLTREGSDLQLAGWRLTAGTNLTAGTGTQTVFTLTQSAQLDWQWVTGRVVAADLAVAKYSSPVQPAPGDAVTYTLQVANLGPNTATGIVCRDTLQTGLVFVSASGGAFQAPTGRWSIPSLAPGSATTMTLTALAVAPTTRWVGVCSPLPGPADAFGSALAAVGTDRMLVGAPLGDDPVANGGAAWLLDLNGQVRAALRCPGLLADDRAGHAVAALGDRVLAVGAPSADGLAVDSGLVCFFDTNGAVLATCAGPDPDTRQFGSALAPVDSGSLLVGAPLSLIASTACGRAYLVDTGGQVRATFNPPAVASSARFGAAVCAVNTDLVAIAEPSAPVAAVERGIVHLFRPDGSLVLSITNPLATAAAQFGASLAAFGGNRLLIGAPAEDAPLADSGVVHLYDLSGTRLFTITNPTPQVGDQFGRAVAVSTAGVIAVGAPLDDPGVTDVGAIHLFSLSGEFLGTRVDPELDTADQFGSCLVFAGDGRLVVGAPLDNAGATDAGAVFVEHAAPAGLRYLNRLEIAGSAAADPVASNNTAHAIAVSGATGNLALAAMPRLWEVSQGLTNHLTVTLTNSGTSLMTGIRIAWTVPATEVTLVSTVPSAGYWLPAASEWRLSALPPGASATLVLAERIDANTAWITNTFELVEALVSDTSPADDRAVVVTRATTNNRASLMPAVNIVTPYGLAQPTSGTYAVESGTVFSVTMLTPIVTNYPNVLTCTGWTVSGSTPLAGTGTQALWTVEQPVELRWHWATTRVFQVSLGISKTVDQPNPAPGDIVTYTITASNGGPDTALSPEFLELLPAGLTFVSGAGSNFNEASGVWAPGSLVAGGAATLDIAARVDALPAMTGLLADPTPSVNGFGARLAIALDGRVAVAATNDDTSATNAGIVHVFSGAGAHLFSITNPTPAVGDAFGAGLDWMPDGRLLVGAPGSGPGRVHVFGGDGVRLLTLIEPSLPVGARFGSAVASAGNDLIVVGAPCATTGALRAGAVFTFDTNGTRVVMIANPQPQIDDRFGGSLVCVDDAWIVAGSALDDDSYVDSGMAYVFSTAGALRATVSNPVPASSSSFAASLAACSSNRFVVGAPGFGVMKGQAYLFDLDGLLRATFTNRLSVATGFGASVAVCGTNAIVVGTPQGSNLAGVDGVLFLFTSTGIFIREIANPNPSSADQFGSALAGTAGSRFAVGSEYDNLAVPDSGGAYVFDLLAGVRLDNEARIRASAEADLSAGDNSAVCPVFLGPSGDVAVAVGQAQAESMDSLTNTYTILLANTGSTTVSAVRVRCSVSAGGQVASRSADRGIVGMNADYWDVYGLTPGATARLTIVARMLGSAGAVTCAALRVSGSEADLVLSNDSAFVVTRILGGDYARTMPEVSIVSAWGAGEPPAGLYTYPTGSVVTARIGPTSVTSFPLVIESAGWTGTGMTPASGSGTQITFTVTGSCTLVWNWATNAITAADIVVGKSAGVSTARPGDLVTFTLTASNRGPDYATAVRIRDLLPSTLAYVGHSNGAYSAVSGIWTVDVLEAGASTGLVLQARVQPGSSARILLRTESSVSESARFGQSTASLPDGTLAVGAPRQSAGVTEAGVVYLFTSNGTFRTLLTSPIRNIYDRFGEVLTAVGDKILAGIPGDDVTRYDVSLYDVGSACLFDSTGGLRALILNPAQNGYDQFGYAVAALGTNRLVIGAPGSDVGAVDAGQVYIFDTDGLLVQAITNPVPALSNRFGSAVTAIGTNWIIVGEPGSDRGGLNAGAVHVFDGGGRQITTITNPGTAPTADDAFGTNVVALGTDLILVAAPGDDTGRTDAGVVHLMRLDGTRVATATNPSSARQFGAALAALGPDRFAVGAPQENTPGAVWIFATNGALLATLVEPFTETDDAFGYSLAAAGEGRLLVGAMLSDANASDSGAAWVFGTDSAAFTILNRAARIGQTELDPDPANDSGTARVVVGPTGNVSVSMSQDLAEVLYGQTNRYIIAVSNRGATAVEGTVVTFVPAASGALVQSVVFTNGNYDEGALQWVVPSLSSGAAARIEVFSRIYATNGTLTNSASIVASSVADDVAEDNTATIRTRVVLSDSLRTQPVLVVSSAWGSASPPVGSYSVSPDAPVEASVGPAYVTNGLFRWHPEGWTFVRGVDTNSGGGTLTTFTVTQDCTLTWRWTSDFYFAATATPGGSVDAPDPAYLASGTVVSVMARPMPGFVFIGWGGITGPAERSSVLTTNLTGPALWQANFAPAAYTAEVLSASAVFTPPQRWFVVPAFAGWTNAVPSPIVQGLTQHVASGWTAVGIEPATGDGAQAVLLVTNGVQLTWNWAPWFWLAADACGSGGVAAVSGFVPAGTVTTLIANAAGGYHFTNWAATIGALVPAQSGQNPLTLTLDGAYILTARFDDDRTAFGNVSIPWLIAHGFTDDFEFLAATDLDGDGWTTAQEALAGTDPVDPTSVLRLVAKPVTNAAGQVTSLVFRWPGGDGPVRYDLERSTNGIGTQWFPVAGATNLQGALPELSHSLQGGSLTGRFEWIRVRSRLVPACP